MAHQIHNIYTFDNEYETILDLSNSPNNNNNDNSDLVITPVDQNENNDQNLLSNPSYWRPSSKLQRLYTRFQNTILSQWPRIACVYCGKLLYPQKANWISHNPLITYPIQQNIPNISLSFNPNINRISTPRIPICDSCKKPSTRFPFPHLSPIPEVIKSLPLHKRKHLSPIYLHCSLGRNLNSNPYSEYRNLTGTMNYSRNIRAHALYSRILGAFLEPNNNITNNIPDRSTHDVTIQRAAAWLAQNNPIFDHTLICYQYVKIKNQIIPSLWHPIPKLMMTHPSIHKK